MVTLSVEYKDTDTNMDSYDYTVSACVDPQIALRIAGIFSQRDIVPDHFSSRRVSDRLWVAVRARLETEAMANLICEKIRALVGVEAVDRAVSGQGQ